MDKEISQCREDVSVATFPEEVELNSELKISHSTDRDALVRTDSNSTTLPGQPRIGLDITSITNYLVEDLLTPELDRLAPKLWLVSTPASSHISALHHQAIRGRSIVITENPQLHLVWSYKQIFIKPIPKYLLSHAFWQFYFSDNSSQLPIQQQIRILKATLGFMRTYCYLIKHESDFRIAKQEIYSLIPDDDGKDKITWERFAKFISKFAEIDDEDVAARYGYGELRLTRLNFYTRIFLFPKLTFHHIDAQWGAYFGRFFAPLLFIFGVLTLVLSAMQVELAVQGSVTGGWWATFSQISRWFSIITIIFAVVAVTILFALLVFMFVHDHWFALRILHQKNKAAHQATRPWMTAKSGVV